MEADYTVQPRGKPFQKRPELRVEVALGEIAVLRHVLDLTQYDEEVREAEKGLVVRGLSLDEILEEPIRKWFDPDHAT